jgi:hypothetical protein
VTDDELIDELYSSEQFLPGEVIEEIVARPAMASRLAQIIRDEKNWDLDGPLGWGVVHATLLLAAINPADALDVLLAALRFAEKHGIVPVQTEMPARLAALGPPVVDALRRVAVDEEELIDVRLSANSALALIADLHPPCRALIVDHLRAVAALEDEDEDLREGAAIDLLAFAEERDRPILQELAGHLVDEDAIDAAIGGKRPFEVDPPRPPLAFYEDTDVLPLRFRDEAEELEELEGGEDYRPGDDAINELLNEIGTGPPGATPPAPKVGRNDPCPCGSGKKYKKCCGQA